jgi:hypothetical protein
MQTMPDNIATLLKSKSMRGANKPAYRLTIEDNPVGGLLDPASYTTWRTFVGPSPVRTSGNMCAAADGRAVIVYVESGAVKLAYADSVPEILDGTKTFNTAGATTLISGLTGAQTSIDLIAGKLNICITHVLTELCAEFWRDTDGNGTGMAKVSDIATDLSSGYAYDPHAGLEPSMVHRLGSGALVVMVPWLTWVFDTMRCCYSLDEGATWSLGPVIGVGLGSHLGCGCSKSFLIMSDTSFVVANLVSSGSSWMLYYTDNGASSSEIGFVADWGAWPADTPWFAAFATVGDKVYICRYVDAYKIEIRRLKTAPTAGNLSSINDWEYVATVGCDEEAARHHFTLTSDALILQHSARGKISGAGTRLESTPVKVKKIEVNRQKGMAAGMTLVLDNKGGQYSPDKAGSAWYGVLWPNKKMVLQWGYGTDLAYGFTGLIDKIQMSSFPQEMTIVCRDMLKLALDQKCTDEAGNHVIYYTDETPEDIFRYLALAAGYASADIVTEATGLTLPGFLVSYESYADAFTRLCEMVKFEYYCDNQGILYYVHSTDRSPAVEGEAMVLAGTGWADIPGVAAGHPVVLDSDIVTNGGGAAYSRETDYEIRLGGANVNAAIRRRPGSAIGDGATVYAGAVYAAWIFSEGEDIVKLDYTIEDKDLYYSILVQGASAEDESAIEASADYISKEYYNVLEQKILVVSASGINDLAVCQEIADRNEVLMRSRPRYTEFGAVANPWLDTGDCSQVIESSSTISEIYRPLSEIITMEPGTGFIMQLGAYHYGYAPI